MSLPIRSIQPCREERHRQVQFDNKYQGRVDLEELFKAVISQNLLEIFFEIMTHGNHNLCGYLLLHNNSPGDSDDQTV